MLVFDEQSCDVYENKQNKDKMARIESDIYGSLDNCRATFCAIRCTIELSQATNRPDATAFDTYDNQFPSATVPTLRYEPRRFSTKAIQPIPEDGQEGLGRSWLRLCRAVLESILGLVFKSGMTPNVARIQDLRG